MKGNVSGLSVGASFATNVATVQVSTPKLTAPFPAPLALAPVLPPQGGEGVGTDWPQAPSDAFVHSVNNLVVFPSQQHDLPYMPQSVCSVPVPVISGVPVYTFSPLSPVSGVSPLWLDQFQLELRHHPDRSEVAYVISGIQEGFRVGFEASLVSLKPTSSNMRTSSEHPSVIDLYLQSEVSSHRVAGPFPASPFPSLHISHFGVIPKSHQPRKWHLILDLYFAGGAQHK